MEIQIRGLETTDWEAIATIHQFPQCQRQTLRLPYQSGEFFRQRIEKQVQSGHGVVAVVDAQVVGVADLILSSGRRAHVAGVGIAVRDDYHGHGIGSALMAALINLADNWLNLKRLELTVYCDNERAIALYQKYGFEIEGRRRYDAFRDGEFVDTYAMSRIRE